MLKLLVSSLVRFFTPFNVFQYITFRAAYAAITSLLICFIIGPSFIRFMARTQLHGGVRVDTPLRHQEKKGTPTMGGVLIIAAITISSLLWMDVQSADVWIALGVLVSFGILGFVDDMLKIHRPQSNGMSVRIKLISQVGIAIVAVGLLMFWREAHTSLIYVPFFKQALLDLSYFYIPIGVLLLVLTSNAVNLTDGLDGLAIGLIIMMGITFAFLGYISGRVDFSAYLQIPYISSGGEIAVLCSAIVGGSIGFLWFNAHPAEIMMGDTGSLALGGGLGMIALLLKKEILLAIIGGVFMIEAASVIIQVVSYRLRKKRVFLMAPLHHHFEMKNWHESKIVIRFWILGGLFAIISLSILKIQ